MTATGLDSEENRNRSGSHSVDDAVARAEEVANGYDAEHAQYLREQVRLGYAVAITSRTPNDGTHFLGIGMPLNEDTTRVVLVWIDGHADIFEAKKPSDEPSGPSKKPASKMVEEGEMGDEPEVEVEVVYDVEGLNARASLSDHTGDDLMMLFTPGATPVEIDTSHPYDIHGVRTGFLSSLHHYRAAWRSTIIASQVEEVAAAVEMAFQIAPELKQNRDAAALSIRGIVKARAQGAGQRT